MAYYPGWPYEQGRGYNPPGKHYGIDFPCREGTPIPAAESGTVVFSQDTTKTTGTKKLKADAEMQKDSVYYSCPMHTDVNMDKTGKCPKCGMDLEMQKMKSPVTIINKSDGLKSYTCPMHSEVVSDKPGKCHKCSMDLVPKK